MEEHFNYGTKKNNFVNCNLAQALLVNYDRIWIPKICPWMEEEWMKFNFRMPYIIDGFISAFLRPDTSLKK
jgi:hypothetical protein